MKYAFVAAMGVAAFAGTASATTISVSGTTSYKDTTTANNGLTVQDTFNSSSSHVPGDTYSDTNGAFTVALSDTGTPSLTIADFLTLCINYNGNKSGATDDITVTFKITNPAGSGTGSDSGAITETETGRFNVTDKGSLVWSNPVTIALGNGDDLSIVLSSPNFTNDRSICSNQYDLCGNVNATFTLTDPSPTPTPEPASLALLGAGLLGLGLTRRAVRRS